MFIQLYLGMTSWQCKIMLYLKLLLLPVCYVWQVTARQGC